MDYILGDHIGRSCLCAKKYRDRSSRPVTVLDVQVTVDGPQEVELLSLVLVQALDLHVIDGLGVNLVALIFFKPCGELVFFRVLPVQDALQESLILRVRNKLLKLSGVRLPALADLLGDQLCQLRVALDDPSAESDAVGLVVELLGIELVEIVELCLLENVSVFIFCLNSVIHPLDDRHKVRHDSLEEVLGPCLQRLCKDRMVRVGTDVCHDRVSFLLINSLLSQKTHQFRND